jgi:hypothetical protein
MESKSSPLFSHRTGDALEGTAAGFGSLVFRQPCKVSIPLCAAIPVLVDYDLPLLHNLGWHKKRQVLQPQTGFLPGFVPELIWLDNLVWLAVAGAHNANGILNANALDCGVCKRKEELDGILPVLLAGGPPPGIFRLKPAVSCCGQIGARRVRNHKVPPVLEMAQHIILDVRPFLLGWKQIARPSIMAAPAKSITDDARKLARDQDAHWLPYLIKQKQKTPRLPTLF